MPVQGKDGYSNEDKECMLLSKITEDGIRITSKYLTSLLNGHLDNLALVELAQVLKY